MAKRRCSSPSQEGHVEIVTKLIAANADVNQADMEGVTPLWIACQMGHTEVVTALIAANADVNQGAHDDNPARRDWDRQLEGCEAASCERQLNQASCLRLAADMACDEGHADIVAR